MHKNALLLTRSIEGFETPFMEFVSALGKLGWRFYLLPETLERFKKCADHPAHCLHSIAEFVAPNSGDFDQLPPEIRQSLRTHRGNMSDAEELKKKGIVLIDMIVVSLAGYGGIVFPKQGEIFIDPHALLKAAAYAGKVAISRIEEFYSVARFMAEPHMMTRHDWYVIGGIPGIRAYEGELALPYRPVSRSEQMSFIRRCLTCVTPGTECRTCSDPFRFAFPDDPRIRTDGEASGVALTPSR